MISPAFYNKKRLESVFLGGKVPHFPVKDRSVVTETKEYVLKYGEDFYTLAERIFGYGLSHMWTYIADCNPDVRMEELKEGDMILLPRKIIRDGDTQTTIYTPLV